MLLEERLFRTLAECSWFN